MAEKNGYSQMEETTIWHTLDFLGRSEQAQIAEIKGQQGCSYKSTNNQLCHIEDSGLSVGKFVEMLNNEGRGPLLLKLDESKIAIGREMAMKIMLEIKS